MNTNRTQARRSSKAIASLVLAIAALGIWFTSILAVILGHRACRDIRTSQGQLRGLRIARLGLIIGYCVLILYPVVVAAIAVPNLIEGRRAANERAAVETVRQLNLALTKYAETSGGYPSSLLELSEKRFIPKEKTEKVQDGYRLTYIPGQSVWTPRVGRRVISTYELRAEPLWKYVYGRRYFYLDQSGIIRVRVGKPADASCHPLD